ncbi:glycerol-3-phosphate dehydrogenase [Paraphotobacterium marinum]|uniref:Glycerol-3-phosphate dehydrogenase [NAD(P)+] n=1 Tax=Paraphotobacterium marinum TaxID=1755811 RepID=A0A220VCH0_9GAMM|nr:NAD(P)H-dependent glycerol-3-phosphate dehydrogenase [Paraphotobacterium marinum]ASK78047.1 glycerol-3-phosphate dehydrogenase [Paraphotobacterium marinum]
MSSKYDFSIIGAGSFGTSFAISLSRQGKRVLLFGRSKEGIDSLSLDRENKKYLPNISFPSSLDLTSDLKYAISCSYTLLIFVPTLSFRTVLNDIKPFLSEKHKICWATKGLDPVTGNLLKDTAEEILGSNIPLAFLSGPNFAREIAEGLPTVSTVVSDNEDFLHDLQTKINCSQSLRVYTNNDFTGVQLGSVVKNVIAIAAGISDGMGFGANARVALITRGLAEMVRLAEKLGAHEKTIYGMSGLGDLVLTCTDNKSRNRRFGLYIGQGQSLDDAKKNTGKVVEGFVNAKQLRNLAKKVNVEMPIVEQVYNILYNKQNVKEAIEILMSRSLKSENL